MIIFNFSGALMLLVAFGMMFGVRFLTDTVSDGLGEGPEMILCASLCILFDVTYRSRQTHGHWISPFGGGNIMFIPVWGIGAIWFVVGVVSCCTKPIPAGPLALTLLGLLVVLALGLSLLQVALADGPDFSDTRGEGSPIQSKRTMKRKPCPACDLPCDDNESEKCPWCGVKLRADG